MISTGWTERKTKMAKKLNKYVEDTIAYVREKHASEPEFVQTVEEVLSSLSPVIDKHPEYKQADLLKRMVEPERMFTFRVVWTDDKGETHTNIGYRCQFNGAIGPYKGGLRFQKNVYPGIIKFLGFEQTFKNSLTGLPIGGGKGGSDFDPAGKSAAEVMRFCQAFMTELCRHVGPNTDVPAGDMNVGGREIGYLFGQYRKITNEWNGVLTGKALSFGGSLIRPEATGYGCVYFAENMLATKKDNFKGKICAVSGSGNVASYAAKKLITLGAKVVTLSDRSGAIYAKNGLSMSDLETIMDLKSIRRGELSEIAKELKGVKFFQGVNVWQLPSKVDCAFPCARQNELNGEDAAYLLKHGCRLVAEGANMPSTPEAVSAFLKAKILYAPGKAANAGGVATSGLEMSQNAARMYWSAKVVDDKLREIMCSIHDNAYEAAAKYGHKGNYVMGANIAGFTKVADAMVAQGI